MPETFKKKTIKAPTKRETKKPAAKPASVLGKSAAPEPAGKSAEQQEIKTPETITDISDEEVMGAEPVWAPHPSGRDRYFEAVGRRKTAVARVRLFTKSGAFTVNDKAYGLYFPTLDLQKIAEDALKKMKLWERFRISVIVSGGGIHAQAEAVRHGLARCLITFNPDFRKRMKRAGFLTRDPRMKERKKFGLKKARRAPQWAKR